MQEALAEAERTVVLGLLLGRRKIVLAGHSHVVALTNRLQSENLQLLPIAGYEEVYFLCGCWPREGAYWDALKWASPSATIVFFWCGNEHVAHFLFRPEPLFDFVPAGAPESVIDEEAILVPESLIRAKLSSFPKQLASYLRWLRPETKARLVVAGSPLPKGDEAELKRLVQSEWYFRDQASRHGLRLEDVRITPAPIRLKLWRVTQDLMAEAAGRHGCEFFPVPDAAMDEGGFLRRELWAEDASHANAAYGKIMLDALASRFGS
jgi:hypothetical protein